MKRAILLFAFLAACGDEKSGPAEVKTAVVQYWVLSPDAKATVFFITTEGTEGQTSVEGEWRFSAERPKGAKIYVKAFCKTENRCRLKAALKQDGFPSEGTEATSEPGRAVVVERVSVVR